MKGTRKKDTLNPRQMKFVEAYLVGGNAGEAARAAGYSAKNSRSTGMEILKSPAVKLELEKHREAVRQKSQFNLEKAVEYAEAARKFAIEKNNPMAVVKANELLFRLHGLLIDRHQIEMGISINHNLQLANQRIAEVYRTVGPTALDLNKTDKFEIEEDL